MKTIKNILIVILMAFFLGATACGPRIKSQEDQETIKKDSLDPQEGKGEGPVPDEVIR